MAYQSKIPKTTIIRHMSETKRLMARSSYHKRLLTQDNTKARLDFAMNIVRPSTSGAYFFASMHEYVHVDEKWFYLKKVKRKFYVYDDEDLALRSVKSKQFITKVAAVARPPRDPTTKALLTGKLACGRLWKLPRRSAQARTASGKLL
ncbi:hypothetical protein DYB37_010099 [Aphanomyces astaci]|nr:hypothetical protein DYB36_011351 [Aphanomyces astaci]RHY76865.1 hypothetical protein DYB30_012736 [Aphanomyces astaci]RHY98333.1 hypothetical protein DYB35_010712 [Aphanomyces astaci]RHZ07179.1 hypothetical protein DYB26_010311 [Aphanomyces astaci]RHZ24388.1 hypothetical protein DYB37_010099 [Aphanomyces astaci]